MVALGVNLLSLENVDTMKKSTIWILTIVMALTFVGLLYVQIMYMEEMIKMREQHFSEGVKRSLYALSTALEQNETKKYLEEDLMLVDPNLFASSDPLGLDKKGKYGLENDYKLSKPKQEEMSDKFGEFQEALKGQYLYQKGLLNEVILTILNQSSTRPITERADSAIVKTYLRTELDNNGINLPFEYAIIDRHGRMVYESENYDSSANKEEIFTQTLFPNDPDARRHYMNVYFPDKDKFIFSSVTFMIPAFAFTVILLLIFLLTIIMAFRQKKLSEMKNDFINNMTHEFKTPISTISLAAQMLNDDSVRKSPNMMQHISTVINDETKRLRFQVEKVLQMSMFDRQKATLKLQEVDANSAIYNIVNTFKLKVEKYGGCINASLDAEDPIVNVDEMHFTNVIFNLLDNAVKYRREDTPLELNVVTRNLPNGRIEISIQDNGIGMKKDDLKKIFAELKGDIRAESELNKGSKFIITLPIINS